MRGPLLTGIPCESLLMLKSTLFRKIRGSRLFAWIRDATQEQGRHAHLQDAKPFSPCPSNISYRTERACLWLWLWLRLRLWAQMGDL